MLFGQHCSVCWHSISEERHRDQTETLWLNEMGSLVLLYCYRPNYLSICSTLACTFNVRSYLIRIPPYTAALSRGNKFMHLSISRFISMSYDFRFSRVSGCLTFEESYVLFVLSRKTGTFRFWPNIWVNGEKQQEPSLLLEEREACTGLCFWGEERTKKCNNPLWSSILNKKSLCCWAPQEPTTYIRREECSEASIWHPNSSRQKFFCDKYESIKVFPAYLLLKWPIDSLITELGYLLSEKLLDDFRQKMFIVRGYLVLRQ